MAPCNKLSPFRDKWLPFVAGGLLRLHRKRVFVATLLIWEEIRQTCERLETNAIPDAGSTPAGSIY